MTQNELAALQQLLIHCREINELLSDDRKHFINHSFASIEESNQEKIIVLKKMSELLAELENVSASEKSFQDIFSSIKSEITGSYKNLVVNSGIVFSNLQQLKTIWDKLFALKASRDNLYDVNGKMK